MNLSRIAMVLVVLFGTAAISLAADGQRPVDENKLGGNWLRPDGGYLLDLANIQPDGKLTAAYFNPRRINVSQAAWSRKEGGLTLFVELRDINYPGSTYTLTYDPGKDVLLGVYFQAATGQSFEIFFVRRKP
jgi:hypothetical protein